MISRFLAARDAWEQAADALPYYGEWAVRTNAVERTATMEAPGGSRALNLPESSLPGDVSEVLTALGALTVALMPPGDPGQQEGNTAIEALDRALPKLEDATNKMNEALQGLIREFEQFTNQCKAPGTPRWVELDAALRVPLIPFKDRVILLEKILKLDEEVAYNDTGQDKTQGADADVPPDRGFWTRAAGLAQLDLTLRQLGPESQGAQREDLARIGEIWSALHTLREPQLTRKVSFEPINQSVAALRGRVPIEFSKGPNEDAARDLTKLEKNLRIKETTARTLTPGEVDTLPSIIDKPVRDRDRLMECACLEFHLSRLQLDYAGQLGPLAKEVQTRRESLGLITSASSSGTGQGLRITVKPDPDRDIDYNWKSDFTISVEAPPDLTPGRRPIPEGFAFVGVIGTVPGLALNGLPTTGLPGDLVRLPLDQSKDISFSVEQKDQVKLESNKDRVPLEAKLFYRGQSELADQVQINLKPRTISERIKIRISQDQEKLRAKYPHTDRPIPDQFREHEGLGFIHKGKDLDYVVQIQNLTPQPLSVTYRLSADDGTSLEKKEVLQPGMHPIAIPGQIKSSSLKDGRGRLIVEVKEDGATEPGKQIPPYQVTFREIGWKEYMEISAGQDNNFTYEKNGQSYTESCFVVTMLRKKDDPVTEPISKDELKCEFSDDTRSLGVALGRDTPRPFLWSGEDIKFYQPLRALDQAKIKWVAHIDTERVPSTGEK